MPRRKPWKTSLEWDLRNGLAHTLGSHAASYRRLTYESLVTAPDAAVAQIAHQPLGKGRYPAETPHCDIFHANSPRVVP